MNEPILEKVRQYAEDAHGEQKRKYSEEKYIRHPERVMKLCSEYNDELTVLAAALLHDVLEDTPVTTEELERYLLNIMDRKAALETISLVVDLTDIYTKANFPQFNRKERKKLEAKRLQDAHPKAQTVKYADIIDNSIDITQNDPDFARVFLREGKLLLNNMNKGNPALHEKAKRTLNSCLYDVTG
ncbi:MAG: HD domain-containing protein [Candidatus Cyclobacteriaceae bacterium M2_1C_046]